MANKIYINEETTIVWADHAGDYGDSPFEGGTQGQITLASLANAAARQGAKVDLGNPRAEKYQVILRLEFDVAPVDNTSCSLYMAPSPSAGVADDNPGGIVGADGGYTGTAGSTIAESLQQLDFVGSLPCTNDAATVVQQITSKYSPPGRYVSPVILNESGQALEGDDIEMSITMIPIPYEVQ